MSEKWSGFPGVRFHVRVGRTGKDVPLIVLMLALLAPGASLGQDIAELFRQNCTSCHTIGGGRLTGPDLKGVFERQQREWLVQFILDPRAILDSGDAYALKLQREAPGNTVMPVLPGA
jgi:mono/diheme cytochrome c family protein